MNRIVRDKVNKGFALIVIVIFFFIALSIMLKYKNEGETNMPFVINELLVVSSADANTKAENPNNNRWNLDINQYNDVYIDIKKNDNYEKNSLIKSVRIENIRMDRPQKGNVEIYMPSTNESKLFSYEDNLKVNGSFEYKGGAQTNPKTLTIANQGGNVIFRIVNKNVSEFVSNEDAEIAYDGTLLAKTNVNVEDIKFNITFDIVIETNETTFRGTKTLSLPCQSVQTEGVSKLKDENCKDIIFKREN